MNDRPYHEVLYISEEELWALEHEKPPQLKTVPMYYSMNRAGHITFFPPLDPDRMMVFICYEGDY